MEMIKTGDCEDPQRNDKIEDKDILSKLATSKSVTLSDVVDAHDKLSKNMPPAAAARIIERTIPGCCGGNCGCS